MVFVNMSCLSGYSNDRLTGTLAESLLKAEGGAIAVWASSELPTPAEQTVLNVELIRQLFTGQGISVATAALRAKAIVSDPNLGRTWIFFGDPASRLK
jgi:hypothetical protein